MKSLRNLRLTRSKITDVSGLDTLSELQTIDLSSNDVSDLSPLVQNMALGAGASIDVSDNPIGCDDPSVTALLARQVDVAPCKP